MNKSAETNRVLVLSNTRKPLMPCHPARARELLRKGRASVFRKQPFTIIIHDRDDGDTQETHVCIDPGSKTTGVVIRIKGKRGWRCVFGMELVHRQQTIKNALIERRMYRRGRRYRNTRYRPPRFDNRRRPEDWLPPSLRHIVETITSWVSRLGRLAPVTDIYVETTKFDPQKARNPEIQGKEYQWGRNYGWHHFRDRLLYEYGHKCAYCGGKTDDHVLELDHVIPRSRGGSDNENNLVVSCRTCNQDKGNKTPQEWAESLLPHLSRDKARTKGIQRVLAGYKPFDQRDMAAMNAIGNQLRKALVDTGIPVTEAFAADTKYNRSQQGYRKAHWIDAACVGEPGFEVYIPHRFVPLTIESKGHGRRQVQKQDQYGFPASEPRKGGRKHGLKTGDLAYVSHPEYRGVRRVQSVFAEKAAAIVVNKKQTKLSPKWFTLVQYVDGYDYKHSESQRQLLEIKEDTKVGILKHRGWGIHGYIVNKGIQFAEASNTLTH